MRIVSVRELTGYIKERLESDPFLAHVWVRGEVSACTRHPSGHLYFFLKDEAARIRVVMFRSQVSRLGVPLENGTTVVVRGYLGVYERNGEYQLYAQGAEAEGAGKLHAALERLKEKLQREGLFDPARKRALPALPDTVGVVTSPVGAALKDILTIMRRRWPPARVLLAPVSVQGETAPYEIAQAIRALNGAGGVDVIIVGRGGGAPEELAAFNTEVVARAIFESRIPVVSAVGHEKDVTVADLVADWRAPTPSAAAEAVVPDQRAVRERLAAVESRLGRAVRHRLAVYRVRLEALRQRPVMASPGVLCRRRREVVRSLEERLGGAIGRRTGEGRSRLAVLSGRLEALSPLQVLARGYSICRRADGRIVRDADGVSPGERVIIWLHAGGLSCLVEETFPSRNP
ncbi:exodeoxyribonuclease VII large subunit [Candidatus Desulforudis audaxviator]|nr:exodeoxyribonuclease VII large subunit [Candidatus Desulforudis audaxviator]AZK59516.1 Exodeoxyribonuclease VII large subunit [Candidatus Desulforudis audaxviator]